MAEFIRASIPGNYFNGTHNDKPIRGRIAMMPIGIPKVLYRTPGEETWQWVDLWNALYREHDQNIDEEFSNQILATMLYLDSIDSKRVYMYFNGPGGDVTPTLAIYDTMQSMKSPVGTLCAAFAYNLAGFLLTGGEKVKSDVQPLLYIYDFLKRWKSAAKSPDPDLNGAGKTSDYSRLLQESHLMDSNSSQIINPTPPSNAPYGHFYDILLKGNRSAMPLSRIALDSPAGAARGQADDIRNEKDELLRVRDYLFKELSRKTDHQGLK